MDGRQRKNVKIGLFVEIVQKPHQRSGELTEGVIAKILTKSQNHPYGIKVQLESGLVGRIKNIIE
ncbi:YwbE family protein [Polaribacter sp. Z014]|nr:MULTISPECIES: YwbE family protein [unclassified Polaribacter]MCL7763513.1 YwbE family protein [Polaribacter sp. Z014]QVY67506.1 YwbE family protein [Polaribacter sp. Q13]